MQDPGFRPAWAGWPMWMQMLVWLGPATGIALFLMAQNAGMIGSPIVENGKKLDALLASSAALTKAFDERTQRFVQIEDQLLKLTVAVAKDRNQQIYLLERICIHASKDKQQLSDCLNRIAVPNGDENDSLLHDTPLDLRADKSLREMLDGTPLDVRAAK